MKPWEEKWELLGGADSGTIFVDRVSRGAMDDPARARLASAAPLMARALLAVEWAYQVGVDGEGIYFCRWCEGFRDEGHYPDCELDQALRAAGVREP